MRCNNTPLFYLFLLGIVALETYCDKYLYGYESWYAQGAAMLVMVLISMIVFGCGRIKTSKRENQIVEQGDQQYALEKATVVRNGGTMFPVQASELTVGDRIMLSTGDKVPCDCLVVEANADFAISETHITGEPSPQIKKSVGHYNEVNLSSETICFSDTHVVQGSAFAIVLAVGSYSTGARAQASKEIDEDHEEDSDLHEEHSNIIQILICVLIMTCTLLLVQCSISVEISWFTSANIAAMMFVYGFPYILAIPSIWDVALRNTAKQMRDSNVEVQNLDSIEEVASLDYLCLQSIGVLDRREDLEKNQRSIRALQAMGVKLVLVAGIGEQDARRIALETGILKPEHENVCGAVVSGKDLQKIFNGQPSGLQFDITPEYLSVVYGASKQHRETLIDYLSKLHPGRSNANTPVGFGSDDLTTAPPVATVGAIGSGDNDVSMLKRAKISFSTHEKCQDESKRSADMILLTDSLQDVVMAVVKGRAYKDNLMKFLLLQIPASLCGIVMVLSQVFLYETIMVTASYVFLINLIYFPIGIVCLVREDSGSRYYDMIDRWRSTHYPGTKTTGSYMKAESLKFSLFINTIFQIGALATLYLQADRIFTLVHQDLDWENSDPLFVDQDWLDEHTAIASTYELHDLTDKGKMFLILFQTWAYLQIFNIINARRPSFKDINPIGGISILMCVVIVLLLGFQFSLCYVP